MAKLVYWDESGRRGRMMAPRVRREEYQEKLLFRKHEK